MFAEFFNYSSFLISKQLTKLILKGMLFARWCDKGRYTPPPKKKMKERKADCSFGKFTGGGSINFGKGGDTQNFGKGAQQENLCSIRAVFSGIFKTEMFVKLLLKMSAQHVIVP